MIPYTRFQGRLPSPAAHRRFRILATLIAAMALTAALLQGTRFAMLPPAKTTTLWGILAGVVVMGTLLERSWVAAERRARSRGGE